jgi:transcriptional regulator with XRE-family HTH domain
MGTEPWVDRERAIWKVLPLRPQPQPLESFTSYLVRLAEANGLQSIRELVALVGTPRRKRESLYNSPDYPAPSFYPGLAQITGCPEERLQQTTFSFLIRRFERSTYPHSLHQFLRKSLASSLRYCPACLAGCDPPSYSLLWRFLGLPGCAKHGVRLLDQCSHCGSLLPFLTSPPQQALCPTCQGNLRTGQQTPLSGEVLLLTHRRTQDLTMLLSPMSRPLEERQAKMIGKQYMASRQQRGLLITDVASLTGQEISVLMDIEQGSSLKKASFHDYIQYADALSSSLREIFDTDRRQALLVPLSEEQTLKQVEAAIEHLKRQGGPITARTIRNLVGISTSRLRCHPQVDSLLTECLKEQAHQRVLRKNQREEELVKLVEQAIEDLRAQGSRVSQQRIADLLGMTRTALMTYPRVKAQLRQIAYHGPPHDLQRLVQDVVEQAQALGTSLTHRSISEQIGISLATLRGNPQVRAILQRAQNESRQQQENELVNRVEHAIAQLLLRGEKPSLPKVSQIVGRNYASLYHRPQIRELFLFLR